MSKKMTPCEKLGYKVGDKFKVVDGTGVHYAVGSFITLIHDDGSSCPRFNGVHAIFESGDSFFPLDFVEKVAKLKPSKQALADAIHQNGGWRSGANWACQHGLNRMVVFSASGLAPTRNAARGMACWNSGAIFFGGFQFDRKLPNWHQCVLSREEYYHAYPKADADGWVEWNGVAKSPVGKGVAVDVKMQNGTQHFGQLIDDECWGDHWGDASIISYRLHKVEVEPEFCESVMRSTPDPESKPTIEQLAADYRNAKDYADRKQDEADKASMESDAALSQLEDAIAAIGFVITPLAATEKEPELVAAVKVGDQVERVESNIKRDKYNGMVGRLHFIDESDTSTPYLVDFDGEAQIWCHEVKFIRRP